MPVPCRRRQAYDVPSTVSRRTRRSPCSPLPPRLPFICSFVRSLARPPIILLLSFAAADGEPLSKSYATQRRSSVDYFSKSSGSRIFKWRLNETGSPAVSLSFSLSACLGSLPPRKRLSFSASVEYGSRRGSNPTFSSESRFSFFLLSSVDIEYVCRLVSVVGVETVATLLPSVGS